MTSLYFLFVMKGKQQDVFGDARWANRKEIKDMKLLANNGVVLGRKKKFLLPDDVYTHNGPEHIMMMAPTRMGKGINTVLPTLWTWKESIIVNDIKGECWENSAGFRKDVLGHECYMFNPLDETGESISYNPLDRIALYTTSEEEDVRLIANTLVNTEGKADDHWISSATNLLVAIILHVKYANPKASLGDVVSFAADPEVPLINAISIIMGTDITDPDEPVKVDKFRHTEDDTLFMRIYSGQVFQKTHLHPKVAAQFTTTIATSDKERSSIISTMLSKLLIFQNPKIMKLTATSTFSPEMLMKDKISLYLVTPPRSIQMTKPLLRLIFSQMIFELTNVMKFGNQRKSMFQHLVADPIKNWKKDLNKNIKGFFYKIEEKKKDRILFLIDEFPALGNMAIFEETMPFIAGYGLKVLLITQSINQLNKIYTKDNSIMDNCSVQLFLTPNDTNTPEIISKRLGKRTVEVESTSRENMSVFKKTISTSLQAVPLMEPGAIARMAFNKVIIFVPNQRPIFADKNFWWEMWRFKFCINYNIPTRIPGTEETVSGKVELKQRIKNLFYIPDVNQEEEIEIEKMIESENALKENIEQSMLGSEKELNFKNMEINEDIFNRKRYKK